MWRFPLRYWNGKHGQQIHTRTYLSALLFMRFITFSLYGSIQTQEEKRSRLMRGLRDIHGRDRKMDPNWYRYRWKSKSMIRSCSSDQWLIQVMEETKGSKIIFTISHIFYMSKEIKDLRKELQKRFKESIWVITTISELTGISHTHLSQFKDWKKWLSTEKFFLLKNALDNSLIDSLKKRWKKTLLWGKNK